MPQSFATINTVVRRKGDFDRVMEDYTEKLVPPSLFKGDRRSRQIAKRHWVLKVNDGWCTSGDVWHRRTKKEPNKKEEGKEVMFDLVSGGAPRCCVRSV